MLEKNKAIVIGAGLGGLSAAVRLAVMGYSVEVFESNSTPGGKAAQIEKDSFRFDAGPSLLTMPDVIEELFNFAGEDYRNYFNLISPAIICKYFFDDGLQLNAFKNINNFAKEIQSKTDDSFESVINYLEYSKKIYDLTGEMFLHKSLSEFSTYLKKSSVKALLNVKDIDILNTMHGRNRSFFKDKRVIQLFDRYATYTGSNPYSAPGTLNIIQHVEYNGGVYFPDKGIYSITDSLYKLALKKGVIFNFNTKVTSIEYDVNNVIKGIKSGDKFYPSKIVISNIDEMLTQSLLGRNIRPRRSPSTSAVIFYWGIKGIHNELEMHNILFSKDYHKEFKELFKEKIIPSDPTVYIYISSKVNKTDAPEGYENWFVMINTPAVHDKFTMDINKLRETIINKINSVFGKNIMSRIVSETVNTPLTLESKTGALNGSLYGNSSNSRIAAFLRRQNRSRKYKGLYYTGGTVHPGGGMPLVILSAKITAGLIEKYHDKR